MGYLNILIKTPRYNRVRRIIPKVFTSPKKDNSTICLGCEDVSHYSYAYVCNHPNHYSALFAFSLRFGAVPCPVTSPFSMSAAHNAAPTVFVNAKIIDATGTSSSNTAATPKL